MNFHLFFTVGFIFSSCFRFTDKLSRKRRVPRLPFPVPPPCPQLIPSLTAGIEQDFRMEQSRFAVLQFPDLTMTKNTVRPIPVPKRTQSRSHQQLRGQAGPPPENSQPRQHEPGPEAASPTIKPDREQEAGMGSGKSLRTASFDRVLLKRLLATLSHLITVGSSLHGQTIY